MANTTKQSVKLNYLDLVFIEIIGIVSLVLILVLVLVPIGVEVAIDIQINVALDFTIDVLVRFLVLVDVEVLVFDVLSAEQIALHVHVQVGCDVAVELVILGLLLLGSAGYVLLLEILASVLVVGLVGLVLVEVDVLFGGFEIAILAHEFIKQRGRQ